MAQVLAVTLFSVPACSRAYPERGAGQPLSDGVLHLRPGTTRAEPEHPLLHSAAGRVTCSFGRLFPALAGESGASILPSPVLRTCENVPILFLFQYCMH